MSWKDCADSIRTAAGKDLTDDQVIDIFEAVDRRKRALVAAGQLDGLDRRLQEAVAQDADRLAVEAALAKKHAALSVIARDRASRMVERHIEAGLSPRRAVLALFEGTTKGIEGGRNSIAATKLAYEGRYVGGMMARVQREVPHAERMLGDRAFLDDVVREMMQPGSTRNADAARVGVIFSESAEMSRQDLNRLGANIGKLDGWAGAQIHDADKIGAVDPDAWVSAVLPKLDLARTFPDVTSEAEVRAILRNVWENIVFQPSREAPRSPADSDFAGPRNVARALERHRVLHFKSADDWLSYSADFGHGHIFDGMLHHQSRAALNASQMEMLGPNPGATLQSLLDGLRQRIDRDASIPASKKAAEKAKLSDDPMTSIGMAFRIASGAAMIPRSQTMADAFGAVRAMESLSKLGGAVISSITDLPVAIANLRFNGMTFTQAIRGQIGEALRGRGKGEAREVAYLLNAGMDGVMGRLTSPFVANDSAPGAMQSIMATFFRWSGLTLWTDANRAGNARVMAAHLGQQAGKNFDQLDPRLQHVFRQHDIDGATWDVIRTTAAREMDGRTHIVPGDMADRRAELALRRYFADESRSAVLEADAATQRFTTAGMQRGTLPGEVIRTIMQFKAFPIAFSQRVMGRAIQGGEGAGYAGAAHIGGLVAGLVVMGYTAMTLKDAIKGYEPRELLDDQGNPRLKTILAALVQSGGAGIYGDFLFGQASRSGNSALENLAGPALSDIAGGLNLWAKFRSGDAKASDGFNAALSSIPLFNVWWARPALDYLVLNSVREYLSPGALARQDQRRRQDYGQQPIIAPSDRIAFDLF